ncbi:DUF2399 domain-containing protein [Fodinicola feengrottensis]|uniref:DUF2399 domain-containing protein n=1 Tax=Fodinicola feengrottensis TaxID=435914 RepID=A0ABP4UAY6_9ACTN
MAGIRGIVSGPGVGRVTDAPWDPALADAMRELGTAVFGERVATALLDELAPAATGIEREVQYRRD